MPCELAYVRSAVFRSVTSRSPKFGTTCTWRLSHLPTDRAFGRSSTSSCYLRCGGDSRSVYATTRPYTPRYRTPHSPYQSVIFFLSSSVGLCLKSRFLQHSSRLPAILTNRLCRVKKCKYFACLPLCGVRPYPPERRKDLNSGPPTPHPEFRRHLISFRPPKRVRFKLLTLENNRVAPVCLP